jgi:hypothetical protein
MPTDTTDYQLQLMLAGRCMREADCQKTGLQRVSLRLIEV